MTLRQNTHPVSSRHLLGAKEPKQRRALPGSVWGPAEKQTKVARRKTEMPLPEGPAQLLFGTKEAVGTLWRRFKAVPRVSFPLVLPPHFPAHLLPQLL